MTKTNRITTGGRESVYEVLREWSTALPGTPALLAPHREPLTWAGLGAQLDYVGEVLKGFGLGRQDRIAAVLPDGPDLAAAFLTMSAFVTFAPLNPAYRSEEFEFYLNDLRAKALILPAGEASPAREVARELGVLIIEVATAHASPAGQFVLNPEKAGRGPGSIRVEWSGPDDIALVLHTSGTTSRPKLVPLTHRNVCNSGRQIARALGLTPADRGLCVMPLFHIHGLMGALFSSVVAGASVVCTPGFGAAQFFQWLDEFSPTWYTAVPTMHQAILALAAENKDLIERRPLRLIRSSSSALPPTVMLGLEKSFGAPVVEAYGMTEASHQIASNPLPPGLRKPGSVGQAAGPAVAIVDQTGLLLKAGEIGEVVILGSSVTAGYENNPSANLSAFANGWFRTGDQGYLDPDGYLFLTSRLKELINRGGEKIAPREVDEALLNHPSVRQAVAFGMPHPTLGEDVAAAVVLREGQSVTEPELRSFVSQHLPPFKVPSRIVLVKDIPKGRTGKMQRIGLAERLADELKVCYEPPANEMEQLVASTFRDVLACAGVGRHDNFFALGGDSIRAMQVVARLAKRLSLEVPPTQLFKSPTVKALAVELTHLAQPHQIEALAFELSKKDRVANSAAENSRPSFVQERIWIHGQFEPDSPIYNRPASLRFRGPLDVRALERSLNEVVRRHEVLRTRIWIRDGRLTLTAVGFEPFTLAVVDLELSEGETSEERLQAMADAEARRLFKLQEELPWRASLVRLAPDDHALLLTFHHAVFDGWSGTILWDELAALYGSFHEGHSPALEDVPMQYGEFAAWQRERLQGEALASQLAFWKTKLAGYSGVLNLPTDRPRPAVQSARGGWVTRRVPADLTASLKELSRNEELTLFMTLFAGLAALLQRYTGQEDLVVGVPIAGRTRMETERLIGCFINTLAIRIDLSGNPTVRELLQRVRTETLDAFAHQETPFEKLIEVLNVPRDLSRTPLFQLIFQLRNTPQESVEWPGVHVEPLLLKTNTAKTDLTLNAVENPEGLTLECEYSTDLFEAATIARWLGHYEVLLCSMTLTPTCRLGELSLLPEVERHQVLVEWNQTERDYPRDKCVHHLFEEQVGRTPQAVAAVFEGQSLTYHDLNLRANQLAHHLRALGAGPGSLVALCLERSLEMVVAICGTMKAGAAYVPIDPSYPADRIAFLINDANAPVILTQQAIRGRLPVTPAKVICLDTAWEIIRRESQSAPKSGVIAEDLAYVIYTSGSTGKPKGAMNTHRGVVNRLLWAQDEYQLGAHDAVLQKTPFSFDISVWEFFWPLLSGARLVIARPKGHYDNRYLIGLINRQQITTLHFVPSMLRHFLQEPDLSGCLSLRRVYCSGEALPWDFQEVFFKRLPEVALYNLYGPTEAAVEVTHWTCDPDNGLRTVPIGRPIANIQIYILDETRRPVPVGVAGEIYVGGVGLARGYHQRPDLTAERFILNPFSCEPGARLFRTGDLARYLSDGNIEFLGRLDHQVKVRGFRIELDEIELALNGHPMLSASAVVAQADHRNELSLIAFIVGRDASVTVASLRSWLEKKLPDYMIPSRFVILKGLPLLPNGKLDRKALRNSEAVTLPLGTEYVAPRNDLERQIVGFWQEALRQERVGVHDDFFELGGHSVLAILIVSRIATLLKRQVPLTWLFEYRTIEALARQIQSDRKEGTQSFVPIERAARDHPLPMSFGQQCVWLAQQTLPHPATYNVPVAHRLCGVVNAACVRKCLQTILERHEVLRTALVREQDQLLQRPSPVHDVVLSWREADLRGVSPDDRQTKLDEYLREEVRRPFNMAEAPLWRALWMILGEHEHVLALTFHHCLIDEWSLRIFFHEFEKLYPQDGRVESAQLPGLPVQYADFGEWQRRQLGGEALERHRAYWRNQLKDSPPPLDLPTDRPRPVLRNGQGAVHRFQLSGAVVEGLRELAREEGTSLFSLMLAVFFVWLHRQTGQTDFIVGTPAANREPPEVQPLIGFFLNTLPVRMRLETATGFRGFLRRVREHVREILEHKELPFDQIMRVAEDRLAESQNSLFQAMFALLEEDLPKWKLDQAEARSLRVHTGTSKGDLILNLTAEGAVWEGALEYAMDLFTAESAGRMIAHFVELLNSIVANPDEVIVRLNLLSAAERHLLLVEWNRTEKEYPADEGVHHLFEAQAMRTPDALAVVFGVRQLTYAELDREANRLAQRLQQLGVRHQTPVALCVERSPEMITSLLAILKAGGSYVPLDPGYPPTHIDFVINDLQISLLVTPKKWRERFAPRGAHVFCPDEKETDSSLEIDEPLKHQGSATDVAYIIYTSGSTGQPNGVAVPHRAIARLVLNTDYIQLGPGDRVAQVSNAAFDAATFEIWGALLNGATLVGFPDHVVLSPENLARSLRTHRITSMFLTTALFNQVARQDPAAFASVRDLLLGGDVVEPQSVRAVLQHGPPRRLLNVYGPTESTTFATWYRVEALDEDAATVPIGRPIRNTTAYVLDAQLQPTPIGIAGELYLGGDGLAVGYINRPQLTTDRFVAHPFKSDRGERLYRTGDRVRWRTDGNLEFLGRLDRQVKIRGYRIELSEIEVALGTHPALSTCAAAVQPESTGGKCLVAFLVARDASAISVGSLRSWLGQKLPDYMIPSRFVLLKKLPLTSNGKVDLRSLEKLETVGMAIGSEYVAPRTELERQLTVIWQELLHQGKVGVRDSFFSLGGHSLLAVRLAAKIENLFECKLPIAALFQSPTIELLAQRVMENDWAPQWSSLVPLQPLGSKPPLFFVHGCGGDVYGFLEMAKLLPAEQPSYGIQAVGLDGKSVRHITVEDMAAHYVKEIRAFQPDGPFYLAGYSMGGLIAFEVAQQLHRLGRRVALLALLDSSPFGVIPWAAYALRMCSFLPGRCSFHFRRWRDLPWRQRLGYFQGRWTALRFWLAQNRAKPPVVTAPPPKNSSAPELPGFSDYYHAVASAYRIQRYPGPVDVFVSDENVPYQVPNWRYLARGGASFHRVPGKHLEILSPENLPVLAKSLTTALQRAQEKEHEQECNAG